MSMNAVSTMTWDDLEYWQSKDWQNVQIRLDLLEREGIRYCPEREVLFKAMDNVPFEDVRVAVIGQDPYPSPLHATGLAFSIPRHIYKNYPPTLITIFKEMLNDIHYMPTTGDLSGWARQGVLLWNAVPTCEAYKSLSHRHWEWSSLTTEIVRSLEGTVLVFLGGVAREFAQYAPQSCKVIEASHPSPRASISAKHPFRGSRIFSTINSHLNDLGLKPIDWRLL